MNEQREKKLESLRKYFKTKKGIVSSQYNTQIKNSKKRGQHLPAYNKEELREWLYSQDLFHTLFDTWLESGYKKELKPSIDRISNKLGYTMENIRLMTWGENSALAYKHRRDGIDTPRARAVIQMDMDGNFIREFHSSSCAARNTPATSPNIWSACNGRYSHAGGFKWRYADAR